MRWLTPFCTALYNPSEKNLERVQHAIVSRMQAEFVVSILDVHFKRWGVFHVVTLGAINSIPVLTIDVGKTFAAFLCLHTVTWKLVVVAYSILSFVNWILAVVTKWESSLITSAAIRFPCIIPQLYLTLTTLVISHLNR